MKFQIVKGQRRVTRHKKVTASTSKRISRFHSGLKSPYAKVRWLYGYITIILYFFTISAFTYGFMVAFSPMSVKFQWFPVVVFKPQCSTILNMINFI